MGNANKIREFEDRPTRLGDLKIGDYFVTSIVGKLIYRVMDKRNNETHVANINYPTDMGWIDPDLNVYKKVINIVVKYNNK